jgi:8-oxo-dGTP diphosphatase
MEKHQGTSILFVDTDKENILLFLRDDISNIRYPNCWDILGGHVEEGETPEETIIREMEEEIGKKIENPVLFKVSDMEDRIENTFWKKADFKIEEINLMEGQKLKWFSEEEIRIMPEEKIAFNFKPIILEFFKEKPYAK